MDCNWFWDPQTWTFSSSQGATKIIAAKQSVHDRSMLYFQTNLIAVTESCYLYFLYDLLVYGLFVESLFCVKRVFRIY